MHSTIASRIATEINAEDWQVIAAIDLLDGGATVPFVARYRKEITGSLDDVQLRALEERLAYLRELEDRRATILASLKEQGVADDLVLAQIIQADTKARLEDLYLPFKPKRRTKGQIAIEAGLLPLADQLLGDPTIDPAVAAAGFVTADNGVSDEAAALEGARAILCERFAEDADLNTSLREDLWSRGRAKSRVQEGKEAAGAKFADYFDYVQPLKNLPAHQVLALYRGESEGFLALTIDPLAEDPEDPRARTPYEAAIAKKFGVTDKGRAGDRWLAETVRWAWRTKFLVHLDLDIRQRLREMAEDASVKVFAANLRDLLLAAPAGTRATMGLDPGLRTGVKVAVVDATGKVVATDTVFPHEPQRQWTRSLQVLEALCRRHNVELIAIGNGTASRETDKLAAEVVRSLPDLKITKAVVSEAGASVYSASAYASSELPELDVSLRGAVSIARRLQDPLAELVKIDPKSIGVGQYQHDISPYKLARALDAVVEDCVNAVGVDVNTASPPLLARVSGIGEGVAAAIVDHRDRNGAFRTREALRDVPRLGDRTFELCAGFLRIQDGEEPLDRSGVHPEAYPLVRKILGKLGVGLGDAAGNSAILRKLDATSLADDKFGVPTIVDVLKELEKPGRDPRPAFKTATFMDGVEKVSDLKPGMILEGTVTNVAAFGAFVDIGVHQDGLVHLSAMSKSFVKDPRDVVKPGTVVRAKVLVVDIPRNRISLTLRLDDPLPGDGDAAAPRKPTPSTKPLVKHSAPPPANSAFADALRRAQAKPNRR